MHPETVTHWNLRLVDAAVVEDKVDAGKLFARLLGFQVELHHSFVTCTKQMKRNLFRKIVLSKSWELRLKVFPKWIMN